MLVIPEGFGQAVIDEEPTTLRLTTNPAQTILPGIVEEMLSILTDATFYLHRVLGDEIDEIVAGPPDGGSVFEDSEISRISVAINQAMGRVETYLFPPVLELETSVDEEADSGTDINVAVLFLPGIMLMSLMFMAQGLSEDIWREREQGTLGRAVSTPGGIGPLLGGKLVSGGVIILSTATIILTLGSLYLDLSLLNDVQRRSIYCTERHPVSRPGAGGHDLALRYADHVFLFHRDDNRGNGRGWRRSG